MSEHTYDWKDRMRDEGTWQRVKGKVRETWGDMSDDEIDQTRGNVSQLVGKIKQKTGESAEAVEQKLESWAS